MTALISREELTPFLNIRSTDDPQDDLMARLALAVTELAEAWCGRTFKKEAVTEYHHAYQQWRDDPEPQYVWLRKLPVDTGAAFTLKYSQNRKWDESSAVTITSPSGYLLDAEKGLIRVFGNDVPASGSLPAGSRQPVFYEAHAGFRVVYTGGYAANADTDPWEFLDAPAGLKAAAGLWINYFFQRVVNNSVGLETLTGEDARARKVEAKEAAKPPQEVQDLLVAFRRQDASLRFTN